MKAFKARREGGHGRLVLEETAHETHALGIKVDIIRREDHEHTMTAKSRKSHSRGQLSWVSYWRIFCCLAGRTYKAEPTVAATAQAQIGHRACHGGQTRPTSPDFFPPSHPPQLKSNFLHHLFYSSLLLLTPLR